MNYIDALNASVEAEADGIGPVEWTVWTVFLHVWNRERRPAYLDGRDMAEVIEICTRRMSRASAYGAVRKLASCGWLAVAKKGRAVDRVAIGVALSTTWTGRGQTVQQVDSESSRWTGESTTWTNCPAGGLPYYVQEKKRREEEEKTRGRALVDRLVLVLEASFHRELTAAERARLAEFPDDVLDPLVIFYSAPGAEDARKFRRRGVESLLENLMAERDRAVAWLGTEEGKAFRRRASAVEREAWAERLISLPEDILPADWRGMWELWMGPGVPDWPDIGARSRQTFLAVMATEGHIPRPSAEGNQLLARRIVQQWLEEQAGRNA